MAEDGLHPPAMTLTLSELEVHVLTEALDIYIRAHLGQAIYAMAPAMDRPLKDPAPTGQDIEEVHAHLARVQQLLTGIANGGPSIGNPLVSNKARVARRIQGMLDPADNILHRIYKPDGSLEP